MMSEVTQGTVGAIPRREWDLLTLAFQSLAELDRMPALSGLGRWSSSESADRRRRSCGCERALRYTSGG